MAKSSTKFQRQAEAAQRAMYLARELAIVLDTLEHQHTKMDYSDCTTDIYNPDTNSDGYVKLGAEGNIVGLDFSPAQYMNTVNFAQQFQNFLDNEAVATGDYRSTIEQVANPK